MKNKLAKKYEKHEQVREEQEGSEEEELKSQSDEVQEIQKKDDASFMLKTLKKDSLFVTFTGMIESGLFDEFRQLTCYYAIVAGPDWKIISGKKTGVSQTASSKGDAIIWNYPFEISFETLNLTGWPQLIVVLYGSNFLGKAYVKGYGNVHLPTSMGSQKRKIRVFRTLPQSVIAGLIGYYIHDIIPEYRDTQKTLAFADGREVTRTKTVGQMSISVEAIKYNFQKFGYE